MVSSGRRTTPTQDRERELDTVVNVLSGRLGNLAPRVAQTIREQVDYYGSTRVITQSDIVETVRSNYAMVIHGLAGDAEFDTSSAAETGANRADAGVPLPAVMDAYRIGFQMVWNEFMAVAQQHPELSRETLLEATSRMWQAQDAFVVAMSTAHRERTTAMILDDASERAALTQHLLEGRVSSEQSLWEIAEHLRLPHRGPYIAVAARAATVGKAPLASIEAKLASADLRSAWRLLPDQQIGIVHVASPDARRKALDIMTRAGTDRVGVSPPFTDLADTARALRYARVAMTRRGRGVSVFDNSVLGVAAVAAPEVAADLSVTVLGRLFDLPAEDRDPLVETFRVWSSVGGNINDTATRLHVHRNTVRHRLRRIEELTGRSTTAPREVAELCLAFEVIDQLPIGDSGPQAR